MKIKEGQYWHHKSKGGDSLVVKVIKSSKGLVGEVVKPAWEWEKGEEYEHIVDHVTTFSYQWHLLNGIEKAVFRVL